MHITANELAVRRVPFFGCLTTAVVGIFIIITILTPLAGVSRIAYSLPYIFQHCPSYWHYMLCRHNPLGEGGEKPAAGASKA